MSNNHVNEPARTVTPLTGAELERVEGGAGAAFLQGPPIPIYYQPVQIPVNIPCPTFM